MNQICVNCKKSFAIEIFFSKTLNTISDQCNKCRCNGYRSKSKKPKKMYSHDERCRITTYDGTAIVPDHFIVSKNEKCVLYDDLLQIVFGFSNNYTKFQLCILYGNVFNLKCYCNQKALYCVITAKSITCNYCPLLLHRRFSYFGVYCKYCIESEMKAYNCYSIEKDECICNGRRQMYDVPLQSIIFKSK